VAATDGELVEEALAGFEHGFRELVHRYERGVFGVIVRVVRDPSRAEELAQDTFVKAFRALHTYDPARKFPAWLLTIAHRTAIDEVRRHQMHAVELDPQMPDRAQPSPHQSAERAERAAMLRTAIGRLRPEYRELVALKYEQELEYDEIVQITGLPVGTVKSSLHRARKDLVEHLEQLGWRPLEAITA
jgi:RNA polymerase sigma-70 factor, ECF subfamily